MAINGISITNRSMPFDKRIQANGSYTLPQQAFIPAPGTRPVAAGGMIMAGFGHGLNPGVMIASGTDAGLLPGIVPGRATGLRTNTAQIQTNVAWMGNNGLYNG